MYFYDENQPIAYNLEQLSLEPFKVTSSTQDYGRPPRCARCAVGSGAVSTCTSASFVGPGAVTTCVSQSCVAPTCVGPQGGCVNKWTTMRLRDGRIITMLIAHLDSKSVAGTLSTGQYLALDLKEIMELTC
ncbi:hypothetical protein COL36_10355 [Bacillus wiedmannii]|nr:hypothetical protein COL36_10355 [Bacillus wiedmannii]